MKSRAAQADVQSGAPTFEELPMPPAMAALVQRSGRWELPAVAVAAALLGAAAYAGGRTRSGEASIFPACLALLILLAVVIFLFQPGFGNLNLSVFGAAATGYGHRSNDVDRG